MSTIKPRHILVRWLEGVGFFSKVMLISKKCKLTFFFLYKRGQTAQKKLSNNQSRGSKPQFICYQNAPNVKSLLTKKC
jgi:hypothetical protein